MKKEYEVVHRFPFTSSRKRMSTVIEYNGRKLLIIKGASELVLKSCSDYIDFTGTSH